MCGIGFTNMTGREPLRRYYQKLFPSGQFRKSDPPSTSAENIVLVEELAVVELGLSKDKAMVLEQQTSQVWLCGTVPSRTKQLDACASIHICAGLHKVSHFRSRTDHITPKHITFYS